MAPETRSNGQEHGFALGSMDLGGTSPPFSDDNDPEEIRYMQAEERLIISIDVGNSFSSVTMAHLSWNTVPLSRSPSTAPSIRTVLQYPASNPSLTPNPSRTPSLIYYDHEDRPRAHGAECLTVEAKERAKNEGWTLVKALKEQMNPRQPQEVETPRVEPRAQDSKRLLKKAKTSPQLKRDESETSLGKTARLSTQSLSSTNSLSSSGSGKSGTPEDPRRLSNGTKMEGLEISSSSTRSSTSSKESKGKAEKEKKEKPVKVHHGPKLRDIWGDHLKHLVACARAYYGENVPEGEKTFDRLWSTCVFVIPHPSDWGVLELDLIQEAMIKANLVPRKSIEDKIVFIKDSVATTCFAQRHIGRAWLKAGESFVVCDATDSVSITGYNAVQVSPRLQIIPFETVSRLDAGVGSILRSFEGFLENRLRKTKFKSSLPSSIPALLEEFQSRILPGFTGADEQNQSAETRLRIVPEGKEKEVKGATSSDKGARIEKGWMTISSGDVEAVLKPSVDALIVRLSSIVPRGAAKNILLTGGFGESPYLLRRLLDTFQPQGVRIVLPDIPAHNAVSEGALRYYLSHQLLPRKTRYNLGFEVAVDATTQFAGSPNKRDVFAGSGGSKLIKGKFSSIVRAGEIMDDKNPNYQPYHMRYRLASGEPPIFSTLLWAQDPSCKEGQDGWIFSPDGQVQKAYRPVCQITADLGSLVENSKVCGDGIKAFVFLDIFLVVLVGVSSLEAMVVWRENGELRRGQASVIADEFF
ncbi:hypothetical protein JCM16303_006590 [Sporobolomyces ruberrimus]